MQQISFAIGHLLEASLSILPVLGWLPPVAITITLGLVLVFWMTLQAKYDKEAKRNGTLA